MARIVTLASPFWDEALGRSIMPIEGPLLVSNERAAELIAHGLVDTSEDVPDAVVDAVAAEPAPAKRAKD